MSHDFPTPDNLSTEQHTQLENIAREFEAFTRKEVLPDTVDERKIIAAFKNAGRAIAVAGQKVAIAESFGFDLLCELEGLYVCDKGKYSRYRDRLKQLWQKQFLVGYVEEKGVDKYSAGRTEALSISKKLTMKLSKRRQSAKRECIFFAL